MNSSTNLWNWLALYHALKLNASKFHAYLAIDPVLTNLPPGIIVNYSAIEKDLQWLEQDPKHAILILHDTNYPAALRNIHQAPPILYVNGDRRLLNAPQIAMVGSRHPTVGGLQHAKSFAQQLAELGICICSGLATGIDAASHQGALSAREGKTIAVLAHGVDVVYPPSNQKLAQTIQERGCLVSEFPIGTRAQAWHFPQRNRIISGLSLGVLVVEAAQKSGSLITAKYALEQGREVFAIPGSINNPLVRGCHDLIRQGAKLVESPAHVLEELAILLKYVIHDKSSALVLNAARVQALSDQQQQLLQQIDFAVTPIDAIVSRSGLATNKVGSMLLELELCGLVNATSGGYIRVG